MVKLPPPSAGRALPIPLSVVLTLLWVGLLQILLVLPGWLSALAGRLELPPARGFWTQRLPGGMRLATLVMAIGFLLLVYLWLDYRSRRTTRGWVFLVAAALLVLVAWQVWRLWWQEMQLPPPGDGPFLMTGPAAPAG